MTTKLLFYTDPHLTCMNPEHRTDDYAAAMLAKLREAYQIAATEKCHFVVMGGDLFNQHRIYSYEMLNDLMDIFCGSSVFTYAVVGQHDIHAYNPDTFKSSTLSFFARHCSRFCIMRKPIDPVKGVWLYPSHVWDDVNESLSPVGIDTTKINILVAHHLIHDRQMVFKTVPTSLFRDSPYDLVLSGDWHGGFEPHEVNGRWFCNPGSLARQAIDEIDRVPMVAVIEIEKGKPPVIEQRALKSAKNGKDVFELGIIEVINQNREEFDPSKFIQGIEDFELEAVDVHDLVRKVGESKNINPEVLAYLATKKP